MNKTIEVATLGGGCFWCTEAVFSRVKGVLKVVPGYSGGWVENPTYEEVCSDTTGHAEVVQITFDPEIITYRTLLEIFFDIHDPTTKDRQGNDVGSQYRSIILYHNEEQRRIALDMIEELNRTKFNGKIVTEVVPFKAFYEAEDYHHNFYDRNRNYPYCRIIISPKVRKLMKSYPSMVKLE
ncbi:peptide-methionine (S)-S-oxide reductase MsrA [Metallosphaera hakonensis]|uniref:Peptide methionine sulfoxide reductase MsrA n=1 Tax=Metallosphaera hakonensis JCM 8857 = DSM 7519 TaxID=1293036 RepID=A0A2U9ISA2_9CREN|nr:peptide-methionine (S)-S-oxide reductase MsrA [Metallosphaera hakonensis]AWR98885.1 peptide-methionine (S)-S-oxide reductase MsrA [Metallosphaera hakonensis JCM 8857 = DSM 7519]